MNNIEPELVSAFYLNSENLHQAIEFGVSSTWFRSETVSNLLKGYIVNGEKVK